MSLSNLLSFRRNEIGAVGPLDLLILQPTPFCNLNCDYCYLPERSSTKKMHPMVIEAAVRRAFESGLVEKEFTIVWHAGEPLVVGIDYYKNAFELIERLRPKHVTINHSFQTNATLLTDAWCEFIKEHQIRIGVSVDGPAFLHDQHRVTRTGAGTHAKVQRGMQLLTKHGIDFHTISVLTKQALALPEEMFKFFTSHGLKRIGFNVEEREGVHKNSTLEEEGIDAEVSQFLERFYELNREAGFPLNVRELDTAFGAIIGYNPAAAKIQSVLGGQENSPFKIVNVDCEGNFSTFSPELLGVELPGFGKFTFGNVLTTGFIEALKNEKFIRAATAISRGIKMCETSCDYFGFCGGGTPANKIFEHDTFEVTETMHCRLHTKLTMNVAMGKMETDLGISAQAV